MKASLKNYFDQWESPWMQLYYRMVWEQLSAEISLTDKKILDFGSGFGWNANHLADRNSVIAIEPNSEMVKIVSKPIITSKLLADFLSSENLMTKVLTSFYVIMFLSMHLVNVRKYCVNLTDCSVKMG